MNLVALLIAPLVVTHADDTAMRAAVVIVCSVVLGAMIYVSKSREVRARGRRRSGRKSSSSDRGLKASHGAAPPLASAG